MGLLDYLTNAGQSAKQQAMNLWNTATNHAAWTPQALAQAQAPVLANLRQNPSSLMGLMGTLGEVGQFARPYIFDAQGMHLPESSMQRMVNAAHGTGYDGIIFKNTLDGDIARPVNSTAIQILTSKP